MIRLDDVRERLKESADEFEQTLKVYTLINIMCLILYICK